MPKGLQGFQKGKLNPSKKGVWNKGTKGICKAWNKGIKGQIPWNKGLVGAMPIPWNKGKSNLAIVGVKNPRWSGGEVERICKECGKEFHTIISRNKAKFCSQKCYWKSEYIKELNSEEKCIFWKGGITSENHRIRGCAEVRLWREAVFARDNWTCQKTGVRTGGLNAHHIQNFSSCKNLRTLIENGITLSKRIHEEFHKMYGYKNNTREQLNEFLNN